MELPHQATIILIESQSVQVIISRFLTKIPSRIGPSEGEANEKTER